MRTRIFTKILLPLMAILIAVIPLRYGYISFYRAAYPIHYSGLVHDLSVKNGLPPALVFAVIRTESGFNPDARSSVEARGLMQITKDTFEWARFRENETEDLAFEALFDSEVNIRYGTAILRLLIEEFDSVENALCAYHAGWGNVKKWLGNPDLSADGERIDRIPFQDTAYYVDRVLQTKRMYEKLYDL